MVNHHVIENAVFDITFGSEDTALESQQELAGFLKDRLLSVVDRVFDELQFPGRVFRIDELEIDLGVVQANGYQEQMVSRLEERLRIVLVEKMGSIGAQPSPTENGFSGNGLGFEQLEYFLSHGRLQRRSPEKIRGDQCKIPEASR